MQGILLIFGLASGLLLAEAKPAENVQPKHGPVHEVLKLLPVKKIEEIVQHHLKTDPGFRKAVAVLKGEEWSQAVAKVSESPEYKKFAEMLEKHKINITQAISCISDHFKSIKIDPKEDRKEAVLPNLESFVTDVQKVLPLGEFAKLISDENPDFKKIRQDIGTEENHKIAVDLHNLPAMGELRKILKEMKFDIEPYITLIYSFLGWAMP